MSQPLRFPDFFIVGAPRCGTTAMCRYLSRNPQICFSRPKEPHYFSRIDQAPSPGELQKDYLQRYFDHQETSHLATGEGSVSYLYLPNVIERINQINPEAKFIVLVRNPLTMLPSYHLKMRFLLQEDQVDFRTAWELEKSRLKGENLPETCLDTRLLMYSEAARFGVQIERLFNVAGRDRSQVIVFDDFRKDPLAEYRRTLEFLGLDDDGQTDFEKRFESQMYRYHWLQKLLFKPVVSNDKVIDTLQRKSRKYNADGTKRLTFIKRLTNLNKIATKPAPLTPEMAKIVRDSLQSDVAHLSDLLNRDLGFWFDGV